MTARAERLAARPPHPDEDGFLLLESIVAIALISVLMAALTPFFANSISLMSRQRATQVATQIATTSVETLRGLPASDLVTGHDTASVSAQFGATVPANVRTALDPTVMTQAVDNTAASGAGATAVVSTSTQTPATINNVPYKVTTYLGRCRIPTGGDDDDCAATAVGDSVEYVRAVVAVTWTATYCPTVGCAYVTSTLVNASGDPTFNLKAVPPPVPVVVSPGNQTSTTNQAITPLQLAVQSGTGVPTMTWSSTPLPAGLAVTPAGLISGVPTTVTAARTVTVTVTDAFLRTASATFTWTVLPGPTVVAPANQTSSVGAVANVPLTTTCPASPCTYALLNGPPGLSVTAAGVITGTVTGAVQTYSNVTVKVTDANGASATSAVFTWTVLAPPTVIAPGAQTTTTGGAVNLTVGSTCPNAPCSYTLNNGPAGLTISSTGVISGTVTSAAQTFANVTVTITDKSGTSATSAVFTWTIRAKSAVTAPPNQTTTTGTAVSLALTTTCTNAPCTYVLNNGPAGLSVSSAGVISGTVTSPAQVFTAVSVTVTDAGGVSASSGTFTWTVLAASPVVATSPGAQKSTVGAAITPLQLAATGGSGSVTWAVVNALPAGLALSSSGLISGTPTAAGSTSVTVRATDANGTTSTTTFTWTVVARPTIGSPGTLNMSVGASPTVALAYTCPYASCTITLANTVPGLGLGATASRSTSNTTTSLTVTATSGTVYVNGVVQSSALPSGGSRVYAPTVTIVDGAGASTTSAAGAWTVTASTCAATTQGAGAFFALPLDDSLSLTANDLSGNNRDGTYRILGTSFRQAGPCPRDSGGAVTFNGSTGYAVDGTSMGNQQVFSAQIWFKTTTNRGGKLIGYGDSNSLIGGASGSYDRHIYMRNDGRMVFGVYPGSTKVVTSTDAYNDGQWHQVVGTLAPSTDGNPGLRLYVDGALEASDTSVVSAQAYSGYWHIGFDNLASWPNQPTSNFFAGSLAWASVYTSALTPTQVAAMWNAGN